MSDVRELAEMTRDEVARCADSAVVVIPLGSMEQHGNHLPLLTDGLLAAALSRGAVERATTDAPLVLAPMLPIGSSHHHLFECALSLSVDTYVQVLRDVCSSLAESGFRRLFFINGHGGNDLAMRLVANDVILSEPLTIGACSYWNVDSVIADAPPAMIGHAGVYETSMVMHLFPELVRTPEPDLGHAKALFDTVISSGVLVNRHDEWRRIGGVTERPDGASAELGARIVEDRTTALAAVIDRFADVTAHLEAHHDDR